MKMVLPCLVPLTFSLSRLFARLFGQTAWSNNILRSGLMLVLLSRMGVVFARLVGQTASRGTVWLIAECCVRLCDLGKQCARLLSISWVSRLFGQTVGQTTSTCKTIDTWNRVKVFVSSLHTWFALLFAQTNTYLPFFFKQFH